MRCPLHIVHLTITQGTSPLINIQYSRPDATSLTSMLQRHYKHAVT